MDAIIPNEQKCPSPPSTHQHIHQKLNYFLSTNKIPNIIFHGSTGSGKKTILYNFLDRIYSKTAKPRSGGEDNVEEQRNIMKSNILYVNCCHGKGIKFIREELKFFAKMNIHHTTGVRFKTIVLFNADYLTTDAQSALRRCIELFSHNTRFFIVVENMDKLLNPIVSRFCQIYVPPCKTTGERTKSPLILEEKGANYVKLFNYKSHKLIEHKHMLDTCLKPLICTNGGGEGVDTTLVEQLYDNGISALDILAYVKDDAHPRFANEITKIEFYFHKIKGVFRCEKLLMFHLLWKINEIQKRVEPQCVSNEKII